MQDYVNKYRGYEETLRKLEEDQLRYYRDAMIQVFDVKVFNTMIKLMNTEMPEGNPKLFNNNPVLINEFLMRIHLLKRNKIGAVSTLTSMKGSATGLLQQIRDIYHLK